MKKVILAGTVAFGIMGLGAVGYASQGIPDLPAQPLVTLSVPSVMGEAAPQFGATSGQVSSAQFARNVVGESGRTFSAPSQGDNIRFAQIGRVQNTPAG